MTENPVLDVEVDDDDTAETRPFKVVTHKPAVIVALAPFGGMQDVGISVDAATADQTLWWVTQDWAVQVLRAGIALPQLLSPTPGWVAGLDEKWLHRRVGTLRLRDIPKYYQKHPEALETHPRLVMSTPGEMTDFVPPQVVEAQALAQGQVPPGFDHLPDTTLVQMDEMLACVVEVRCWVAHGEVTTAAPYRLGVVGWDSSLFLEMMFNEHGKQLAQQAIETAQKIAAEVDGPPGYALDLGVTVDGTVTVLRAWPAWAAEPLHADPSGVFAALAASHDFDHGIEKWRWSPDLNVYARPVSDDPAPPVPTESESENPDES